MGSITGLGSHFQSELPLHPKAAEFLDEAFSGGWASPAKIHQPSRRTARLLGEAKEIFAHRLDLNLDEIHFLGDTPLAFHLGISGLIAPGGRVFYPQTARSMAYAVANSHPNQMIPVDSHGLWQLPSHESGASDKDLFVWQEVNPETGVKVPPGEEFVGKIFVDAVNSHEPISHPWHAAIWDSRAWQGPTGLSLFGLKRSVEWKNPLPHNDTKPTSGNFSIPLTVASAIALESYTTEYIEAAAHLAVLNQQVRNFVAENFPGGHVAATSDITMPHLITLTIPGVDSQWLVNELDRRGLGVDTGSACMSTNMQPSHVLAAMGLPVTGNIRLRLRADHSEADLQLLLGAVKEVSDQFLA